MELARDESCARSFRRVLRVSMMYARFPLLVTTDAARQTWRRASESAYSAVKRELTMLSCSKVCDSLESTAGSQH
jgi:hypothetical protein